jgi:hypothetical protein
VLSSVVSVACVPRSPGAVTTGRCLATDRIRCTDPDSGALVVQGAVAAPTWLQIAGRGGIELGKRPKTTAKADEANDAVLPAFLGASGRVDDDKLIVGLRAEAAVLR